MMEASFIYMASILFSSDGFRLPSHDLALCPQRLLQQISGFLSMLCFGPRGGSGCWSR